MIIKEYMKAKVLYYCLFVFISCQNSNSPKLTIDKSSEEGSEISYLITDTNFVKGDSVYFVKTYSNNELIKKERFFNGKLNGISEYYYDDSVTKKVEFVLLSNDSVLTNQIIYYDKNDEIISDSSNFYSANFTSDTLMLNQYLEVEFDVSQKKVDSFIVEYYFYLPEILNDDRVRLVTPKKGETSILYKDQISSIYQKGVNRIEGYVRIKEFYRDPTIQKESLEYFDILISEKFYVR